MGLLSGIEMVGLYYEYRRGIAQEERMQFMTQPDLVSTIEAAGDCMNNQGKRYPHQRRLSISTLEDAKETMLKNITKIKASKTFHQLWSAIGKILEYVSGTGELYLYDTALRIGFFMNLLPIKIYLHIGTRLGAKALNIDIVNRIAIERSELIAIYPEFEMLETYELEDVLCQFKRPFQNRPLKSRWFNIIFKYKQGN